MDCDSKPSSARSTSFHSKKSDEYSAAADTTGSAKHGLVASDPGANESDKSEVIADDAFKQASESRFEEGHDSNAVSKSACESLNTQQPLEQESSPPKQCLSDTPVSITDALNYLDKVKSQYADAPGVYDQFLDVMKDFRMNTIGTESVMKRVSLLFDRHPMLIQDFNLFLPAGYSIECSMDADRMYAGQVEMVTPSATTVQKVADGGQNWTRGKEAVVLPQRLLCKL